MNQLSLSKESLEDQMMIEVGSPLELKARREGGWELIFWVFDSFNFTTPFRAMLTEIADALGQDPQKDLQLPAYEPGEDFVEGTLQFGAELLRVYYEYSLSYLVLMSDNAAALRDAVDRIQCRVAIV